MTPIYQVDAFTSEPFKGNPAAVCVLEEPADPQWMQAVAAEMNLSETAFVSPRTDGFDLRWFTPTQEEGLCGHATLATAHVLFEQGMLNHQERAVFFTKSGELHVTPHNDAAEYKMRFPAEPATEMPPPPILLRTLDVSPVFTAQNRMDVLLHVQDEATVRSLQPNHYELEHIPVRGIIVTSASSDPRYDFVSRFFAPRSGIPEDPVTGSAHCCLGPYWAERLGKSELQGYQASARGGHVGVLVAEDHVDLIGKAVTVFSGNLH